MTLRGAPSHLDVLTAAARNLAGMEPIRWPEQSQRQRRGHDFWPPDLYARCIPALYTTAAEEGRDAGDTLLWLHYTADRGEWWVAGLEPDTGLGFGIVGSRVSREWAYLDLAALERFNLHGGLVARDLWWAAKPAREIL